MILCDDAEVAEHCKKLRNLAFENNGPRYIHNEIGYNYRITNMQAAIGVAQLEQVDVLIEKKRAIGEYYNQHLAFLKDEGFKLPVPSVSYTKNIYWVYTLMAKDEKQKLQCLDHLKKNKIGTRAFFICMHQQPVFQKLNLFNRQNFKNAEKLSANGFYIPSGLGLSHKEQDKVISTLKSFIKKLKQ